MEGNVAVLLGQVLRVQCVDIDKPDSHQLFIGTRKARG